MNTYAVYFRPENFNIKADGSMGVKVKTTAFQLI